MAKKVLPYPDSPIFQCYHNFAFPFGVIQANSAEDIRKWVCTKCVNCAYYPNFPNRFNICVWDVWGVHEHILTQQIIHVKKDYFDIFNMDLSHIIKTAIENGCYVHGNYNEKYIPNKWAFGKEDYIHDFLIIGYEDDRFISVGYLADGRFGRFEIPNQNLMDSLFGISAPKITLNLFNYEVGAILPIDTKRMIDSLKHYISTEKEFDDYIVGTDSFGIATHIRLRDFFVDEVNRGRIYIDRRYSRVLYEHKWVLTQVVGLFLDCEDRIKYQVSVGKNLERAKLVHMLGLKMSYTGDAKLVNRIALLIEQIVEQELEYLPSLIELLESKYPI